jgi:hypothetical protein
MAIVINGNDLVTPVLQPGWTVTSDGFGLNTSTTVFKCDTTFNIDAFVVKGTAHPDTAYSYLKLDKWKVSWDSLDIATLTVDYVGIDTAINEGVRTNPNTSSANGLTTENITTHPNFFAAAAGYSSVIAGTSYSPSPLGPLVEIKDKDDFVSIITGYNSDGTAQTMMWNKKQSYVGENGACFESETGGRFIGFVDPTYSSLYGKTNYLATTTTYSGVIYSTQLTDVQALLLLLNTATSTNGWGVFDFLPSWAPVGTVAGVGHVNLLSQINVEQYGSLYKVMYEIRYAKKGWDSKVYVNIAAA